MQELKLHFYPKGPHDLELRHLFKASLHNKRFNWAKRGERGISLKARHARDERRRKSKAALLSD